MHPIRRALAGAGIAIACAGCVPQGPTLAPFVPSVVHSTTEPTEPRQVVIIGDSLTAMSEQRVKEVFAGVPDVAVSFQAFGATRWQHWYERFASVPEGATVLVLLGTNNLTLEDVTTAEWNTFTGLDILRDTGAGCVVWFRLNTTSASYRDEGIPTETAQYNAWFDDAVASGRWPQLAIEDWDGLSAGRSDFLLLPTDPVHYTELGIEAYADAMRDGLGRCA